MLFIFINVNGQDCNWRLETLNHIHIKPFNLKLHSEMTLRSENVVLFWEKIARFDLANMGI